ncbi:MAG: methylated-DNA--[protein]-cysteine S-methyltransferase [Dehalococcoidia bacterium]
MTAADTAFYTTIESPVGPLFLGGSAAGIHRLVFLEPDESPLRTVYTLAGSVAALERDAGLPAVRDEVAAAPALHQLRAYFEGARVAFDLRLAPRGTAFQLAVWEALRRIPPGETRSYGEVAVAVGQPTASRAVGMANGRNPIAIIVPCHRVVGADGTLTGYGGGLERKRWLLEHETPSLPLFASAGARSS